MKKRKGQCSHVNWKSKPSALIQKQLRFLLEESSFVSALLVLLAFCSRQQLKPGESIAYLWTTIIESLLGIFISSPQDDLPTKEYLLHLAAFLEDSPPQQMRSSRRIYNCWTIILVQLKLTACLDAFLLSLLFIAVCLMIRRFSFTFYCCCWLAYMYWTCVRRTYFNLTGTAAADTGCDVDPSKAPFPIDG